MDWICKTWTGFVKRRLDWICKTWICEKMHSEKQTRLNNLFVPFLYQFSAPISPLIKLFELCLATSPFYIPSLRLSLKCKKNIQGIQVFY